MPYKRDFALPRLFSHTWQPIVEAFQQLGTTELLMEHTRAEEATRALNCSYAYATAMAIKDALADHGIFLPNTPKPTPNEPSYSERAAARLEVSERPEATVDRSCGA